MYIYLLSFCTNSAARKTDKIRWSDMHVNREEKSAGGKEIKKKNIGV